MRKFCSLTLPVLAILVGLGVNEVAQAGPTFDYVSTVNVASAPTLPSNPPGFGSSVIAIGSGNSLTFTTNSVTAIDGGLVGGADINYGNIAFNPSGNGTVVSYAVNFNYAVTITDRPSGVSGTVNFTGQVSGFARGTPTAINSTIFNYDVAPKKLTLDGYVYTISVKPSTGPGSIVDGALQGNISVAAVPEPASLLLVGLGGAGLILVQRRRNRRAQAVA